MNKIAAQVAQCMTGFESANGTVTSRFLFSEDFVGFQGHFPDKKVLPGVCQIQSALAAIEKAKQCHVVLKEIVLAKYFAPVGPHEEIRCICTDITAGNDLTVRVEIAKGPTRVAELKLRVALED